MSEKKSSRRILLGVAAVALCAGIFGRRSAVKDDVAASIVEPGEEMRDAAASLPPAVPPAFLAPSRVAVWASPALRRREAEKTLYSRRRARAAETPASR